MEQLRWLPPWPIAVNRVLFGILFGTSSACCVISGLLSAYQLHLLRLDKAALAKRNGMTLLQRGIFNPVTYFLAALWAWAWLAGHSPRRYGAALVDFLVVTYTIGFAYHVARSFRQARSVRAAGGAGGNTSTAAATRLRRLRLRLQRLVWGARWKALGTRRLSPLDRALCQAVFAGNVNNVEVFLRRGANANLRLVYNSPLLVISAGDSEAEIVRLLLEAGADINAVSPTTETTALARAAMQGHQSVVRLLLERGAAVEATTNSGATPLIFAASEGHLDCVRLLLASRVNVNAATKRGMTALMFASRRGSVEMARMLLDAGADADARTKRGRTVLSWADDKSQGAMAMLLYQSRNTVPEPKD